MPHVSTRSTTNAADNDAAGAAAEAWETLRRHLEAKSRKLNDEVAHYPQPIARCDVQLSKLLEQRGRVYRLLERIAAIGDAPPENGGRVAWLGEVERLLRDPEPDCDDDVELALRAQATTAFARHQGR